MANFFLIDHSLCKSGGHHFDYASCVARAANELGYLTTIGTNRSLKRSSSQMPEALDRYGSVRRVFRHTTYQPDSYLAGLQHLTRSKSVSGLLNEFEPNRWKRYANVTRRFRHHRRREKFVRQFAVDCDRFFRPSMQLPGDHAFFTTASELELMGLAVYLSSHVKTLQTHWHLQFHFNLFDGRTPEYERQGETAQAVRACFLAALARLSYHSIHFYTTSETLLDQYNRLGVGEFQVLPYPVNPEFSNSQVEHQSQFNSQGLANAIQQSESRRGAGAMKRNFTFGSDAFDEAVDRPVSIGHSLTGKMDEATTGEFRNPLRITCPGEVRREKGHVQYLQPLVDEIWPTHLSTGNVQIVVQRPRRKWYARKPKIELELPEEANNLSPSCSPIEYFSHPLDQQAYVDLIKSTDFGLLFYDSRVYFSRRAGVLGELLSCGKPVIVPAGSWLAEQIQPSIFRHVDNLLDSSRVLRTIETRELNWNSRNVPMTGGVLSFDQGSHPFDFSIDRETGENCLVLQFDWHWPTSAGVYCRINTTQKDGSGNVVDSKSRVLGYRQGGKVNAVFHLEAETKRIEFSLTNAFHDSTASIKKTEIHALETSPSNETNERPIGSVGVVASDQDDLPNCIDEMVKHFDHYRDTALAFSSRWYSQHEPRRTVNHLVSVGQSMGRPMGKAA